MKILITGSTGFIGSHVCQSLKNKKKYELIRVLRENSSLVSENDPSIIIHDIYQNIDDEKFDNYDAVIHLAWDCLYNYMDDAHEKKIYPAHFKFLRSLIQKGVKNITVIGTCQEYGLQEGCLTETMASKPSTSYARAKYKLYCDLSNLIDATDVKLKWIRVFYAYGEGQAENTLFGQLCSAIKKGDKSFDMSPGDQVRDFIHVEKLADYIVSIALQVKVDGIINCCIGAPTSVKDFVVSRIEELGSSIKLNLGYYPYPVYEPKSFWGDTKKLQAIIDSERK